MNKEEFIDYLSSFTDAELAYEKLINQKKYFRVNTIKSSVELFKKYSKLKVNQSKYWENAFEFLGASTNEVRDAHGTKFHREEQLGNTWEYFLGYIHIQSLSSMIPVLVLDPKEREYILDMCAAPGGKTTQMSAIMKNTGGVAANDLLEKEGSMFGNITRLGAINCIVTNRDAKTFKIRNKFDKALVDAPCTALGGEKAAHLRYTKEMSERISGIQKTMLINAFDSLKVGGELVYSTCTFAKEENEDVVEFLLGKRMEAELVESELNIPHEKGLDGMDKAWRIYPQTIESEGFFIAKIRKREQG